MEKNRNKILFAGTVHNVWSLFFIHGNRRIFILGENTKNNPGLPLEIGNTPGQLTGKIKEDKIVENCV